MPTLEQFGEKALKFALRGLLRGALAATPWGQAALAAVLVIDLIAVLNEKTNGDNDEKKDKPPTGSIPIDETPWSGDHAKIKDALGMGGKDKVSISPDGNVWGENPDGTWSDHGPAKDYTGSGRPAGRKGKDRGNRWTRTK